jgi:uncharacterized protein YdhG (YjbR/CyaY superfamily)
MSDRKKSGESFTEQERAAMKERVKELKSAGRGSRGKKADPEVEVLAKLAEMPTPDRTLGERIHALIKANAPNLTPKLIDPPGGLRGGRSE